jgi:hypothetical protein
MIVGALFVPLPVTGQSDRDLSLFDAGLGRAPGDSAQEPPPDEPPLMDPLEPTDGLSQERLGVLLVRVQLAGERGAPPVEGGSERGPTVYGPLVGVPVRVIQAWAPEEGWREPSELSTDARGEARFSLRAGEYWVYAPLGGGIPGRPGATVVGGNLPNGQATLAWTPAAVEEQGTAEVTLTVVVALL